MTKQFEMNVPDDIRKEFLTQCGYHKGEIDTRKFANLCATWASNQEYEAAHQYILGAVGEGNAQIYQEKRRPKVQTLKEQALAAFEHILSESASQKGMETVLKALQSLPDDLYVDDAVSSN